MALCDRIKPALKSAAGRMAQDLRVHTDGSLLPTPMLGGNSSCLQPPQVSMHLNANSKI